MRFRCNSSSSNNSVGRQQQQLPGVASAHALQRINNDFLDPTSFGPAHRLDGVSPVGAVHPEVPPGHRRPVAHPPGRRGSHHVHPAGATGAAQAVGRRARVPSALVRAHRQQRQGQRGALLGRIIRSRPFVLVFISSSQGCPRAILGLEKDFFFTVMFIFSPTTTLQLILVFHLP